MTDTFCRKGELDFALLDYQQARDMGGTRWDICYRLSVVHHILGKRAFGKGEFSLAERHFTEAIEHSPHTSSFYYCRAQAKYVRKVCAYTFMRVTVIAMWNKGRSYSVKKLVSYCV